MPRRFNTVGPCQRELHYLLEPKERLPDIPRLVQQRESFWLYGPRQTGKTTAMGLLAQDLTAKGQYAAILVSAAAVSIAFDDEEVFEDAFLYELRASAQQLPAMLRPSIWEYDVPSQRIRGALSAWATACPRPLVLLIDDVDTLGDRSLLSLMRQLWGGFQQRGQGFPVSVGFISGRSVNDLPLPGLPLPGLPLPGLPLPGLPLPGLSLPVERRAREYGGMTPGRMFHQMGATLLELGAFTVDDVANLYQSYTTENGQLFTLEAVDRAFEFTQGQPWLVNALAQQLIAMTDGQIDAHHVDVARSKLLQPQGIHLDHLSSRLEEASIQTALQSVLMGEVLTDTTAETMTDLIRLGLCRMDAHGGILVANPLYESMILRHLSVMALASLASVNPSIPQWMNPNGRLNVGAALELFVTVWRQMGDALMESVPYRAIAPYLAVEAFFRRIASVHGDLDTLYTLPQNQVTLTWQTDAGVVVIGVMVWRDRCPDPSSEGLGHLETRLADGPTAQGWLVLIDQRSERQPDYERTVLDSGQTTSGDMISVIRA